MPRRCGRAGRSWWGLGLDGWRRARPARADGRAGGDSCRGAFGAGERRATGRTAGHHHGRRTQEPLDPSASSRTPRRGRWAWRWRRLRGSGAGVTLIDAPLAVALPPGSSASPCARGRDVRRRARARAADRRAHRRGGGGRFQAADPRRRRSRRRQGGGSWIVRLVRNPDILAAVAARRASLGWPKAAIGFAAETQDPLRTWWPSWSPRSST